MSVSFDAHNHILGDNDVPAYRTASLCWSNPDCGILFHIKSVLQLSEKRRPLQEHKKLYKRQKRRKVHHQGRKRFQKALHSGLDHCNSIFGKHCNGAVSGKQRSDLINRFVNTWLFAICMVFT